uniref:KIB1-4 beta-propeller domain-containing protein n=1 Tax=Ananas comosus var. bracteatus TaxID=296719 RepID=A0A6V7PY24_ANACO|nr:unnamed protein product [Ananas comosus var. bracteatus]
MANDDDRRPHSEEEEEEEKAAAATTSDDAIVTCRKTMITASVARRHLLFDVLHNVAAQLHPPSFVCFRETCSAWRSATIAVTNYPHLQRKNSLLALPADPEGPKGDFRRLISPSLNLQLALRFFLSLPWRVFLLRQVPATARVELPPISTLTLPPWFVDNADKWQKNPSYVKLKIVLSAPPDSPDCLAVAVYWFNHLAVRPGDGEWTAVLEPSYHGTEVDREYVRYIYKDAAFVAPRKLLAVALTGRVVSFEFSSSGSLPVGTLLTPDRRWHQLLWDFSREYLANSDGESVLVKSSSAFEFEVFKLVDDDGRGGREEVGEAGRAAGEEGGGGEPVRQRLRAGRRGAAGVGGELHLLRGSAQR